MTLRVKLEIVPFGVEEKMYEIGRLDIFNKGYVGMSDLCSYGAIDLTKNEEGLFDDEVMHNRADGAWQLVKRSIEQYDLH